MLAGVLWRLAHEDSGDDDYGRAYSRLIHGRITPGEWAPVVASYRDLRHLADSVGASLYVVVMPVNGLMGRDDDAARAYPDFARDLLHDQKIHMVDGFAVFRAHGAGRDAFLPQGPDSHLAPIGYRLIAAALADSMARDTAVVRRLGLRAGP